VTFDINISPNNQDLAALVIDLDNAIREKMHSNKKTQLPTLPQIQEGGSNEFVDNLMSHLFF
jgi:hypothetical protein